MTHDELRKLCEAAAKAKDFAPYGLSADVSALHRAAETHMLALLDELERVYAVMERGEGCRISDKIFIQRGINSGKWIVYVNGIADPRNLTPNRYDTIQAALTRAWELGNSKGGRDA